MSARRSLYILLVVAIPGFSALTGALAGKTIVHRTLQRASGDLSAYAGISPSKYGKYKSAVDTYRSIIKLAEKGLKQKTGFRLSFVIL